MRYIRLHLDLSTGKICSKHPGKNVFFGDAAAQKIPLDLLLHLPDQHPQYRLSLFFSRPRKLFRDEGDESGFEGGQVLSDLLLLPQLVWRPAGH